MEEKKNCLCCIRIGGLGSDPQYVSSVELTNEAILIHLTNYKSLCFKKVADAVTLLLDSIENLDFEWQVSKSFVNLPKADDIAFGESVRRYLEFYGPEKLNDLINSCFFSVAALDQEDSDDV